MGRIDEKRNEQKLFLGKRCRSVRASVPVGFHGPSLHQLDPNQTELDPIRPDQSENLWCSFAQ